MFTTLDQLPISCQASLIFTPRSNLYCVSYLGHLIFLPSLFHLQARTFITESWKLVNELIHGQISCTTHIHFHFNSTCFLFLNTTVCTHAEFYLLMSGIPSTLHWHLSYSHSLSKWYPWHHQIWRAKIFANLFGWTNLFPFFCGFGKFGSLFPNPQMTWNWTKVWQTFWSNSKRFLKLPSLHSKTEFNFNLFY